MPTIQHQTAPETPDGVESAGEQVTDALTIGRRIRHLRTLRKLTLESLGDAIGRAPSQISMMENGKREPSLAMLRTLAAALSVTVPELLDPAPADERAAMEIELERAQRGPLFAALGLPQVRVGKSLPADALQTIVGLQREIERLLTQKAATPEEARRANAELRETMRAQDNYFPELEEHAAELLTAVGHSGGPLTQRVAGDMASHLGFSLHYVHDLPHSTRSVTDTKNGRIYLPQDSRASHDPRAALLQALASHILQHSAPANYGEFLRQRVETNYLTAALLLPEGSAVHALKNAKEARQLSIEDLRDHFGVSYETAAHRFTNLATRHLGINVHFMKVHESGSIHKAYENDGVNFPTDALGAIEGQHVCRHWTARVVFDIADRFSPYYQYTDTGAGTYWCTSKVLSGEDGEFSVSVGVPFSQVKWFRGRETTERSVSRCPDASCCRKPPEHLADRWADHSWPSARTHASLLAALPPGSFPGVDSTEVYSFLEKHAP
ncbi:helix-turn-helix domain-containing protein [Saxibacter everestensis]|uniref:Helix-turn-helix domain-containing protein n=1 Tax=Saxibacter everestensis TaxID=2909229 RepID=A0ABY8QV38_9MICO|nr:helix-turn-helix domain-containing protein [Brevibacteriaceae bacterium ZFBP1038]